MLGEFLPLALNLKASERSPSTRDPCHPMPRRPHGPSGGYANPHPRRDYPTLEESLPLAPPGHPRRRPPSRRPRWLVGGCANPHPRQCGPTLGESLPLVRPNSLRRRPIPMRGRRFARRRRTNASASQSYGVSKGSAPR